MMGLLIRYEFDRLLGRSPLRLGLLALYFALAAWAGIGGLQWKQDVLQLQSERSAEVLEDRSKWMAELKQVEANGESSSFQARPMNLSVMASLVPGPVAELAYQRESIHPHTARLSGFRSEVSLFRRYEVEGPSTLSISALDLSYLAIVFYPLLVLFLTFDALSAERQSGRLRLLMVQGASPAQILLARLIVAAVPPWLVTGLFAAGVVAPEDGTTGYRLMLWLTGFSVYAVLWVAVAACIASFFSRVSEAALAALSTWVTGVLLLPSFAQFAGEALYPTPSRVAYLSQARAAEGQVRRELDRHAEAYMSEHGLETDAAEDGVPGYYRASYLANLHINASTAPLLRQFESQREAQAIFADRFQFVAPPMLAYRILQDTAGVGTARASAFRRKAREHLKMLHEAIGPATVGKTRLTSSELRAIPEFVFEEPQVATSTWLGLGWLCLLAVGLGGTARRSALRVRPV